VCVRACMCVTETLSQTDIEREGGRDRAVLAVTGQPVRVDVGVCAVLLFTFGPGLTDLT